MGDFGEPVNQTLQLTTRIIRRDDALNVTGPFKTGNLDIGDILEIVAEVFCEVPGIFGIREDGGNENQHDVVSLGGSYI